jgi:transcriptional regulator with XRE-family HTH domain
MQPAKKATAQADRMTGQRIKELRRAAHLTQTELAERLSRTASWVSQVERGVQRVDRVEVLQQLAEVLGVGVQEIRPDAAGVDAWPARAAGAPGPRSPEEVARAAADALQALNRLTLDPAAFARPVDVQNTAGGLVALLLGMPQAIDQLHGGLETLRQQQDLYTYDVSDVDEAIEQVKEDLLAAIEHAQKAQASLQGAVNRLASVGSRPLPQ